MRQGGSIAKITQFLSAEAWTGLEHDTGRGKDRSFDVQSSALTLIQRQQQRLMETEAHLTLTLSRAAQSRDGRAVFWSDEDEVFYDRDGNMVAAEEVDRHLLAKLTI